MEKFNTIVLRGNVGGNIVLAALGFRVFSKGKERRKNYKRRERERSEFFKVLLSTEEKETRERNKRALEDSRRIESKGIQLFTLA